MLQKILKIKRHIKVHSPLETFWRSLLHYCVLSNYYYFYLFNFCVCKP